MKTEKLTRYHSPDVEIAEISVEAGFAATTGTVSLPGFVADPTAI